MTESNAFDYTFGEILKTSDETWFVIIFLTVKNVMGSDLIWTDGDRVLNKHLHSCSLCVVVNTIDD
jgi:hypothetical protein